MSYTVQDVNGCTKKLVFKFDSVDLTSQIKDALSRKQSTTNLKGFRKGKAPLAMIEQMYGAQVQNEALYTFLSQEFYNAVQKEGIRAIGYPTFGNTDYQLDKKKIAFEATVEILPEVTLKDYKGYTFTKQSAEVTKDDVTATIKRYLDSKAEMVEAKAGTTLAKGLNVVMNFEGEKADGTRPDNMKGSEFMLEIGSNQFIPGFEDAMIGMKKGEKKTIDLTFPADYHQEDLKNAKVKFHVEALEIKEKKTPELNDELAKEFGFDSALDMQEKTKVRQVTQKARESQEKLHQEILEKFIADNKFDVPQLLIEDQKKALMQDLSQNLKQQGFGEDMLKLYFEKWQDDLNQKAEFQVRSGLVLDTLAKKYNVEATESDLDAKLAEMAVQSGMETEQLKSFYLKNDKIKKNLMYAIREEKTFKAVISDMKVS
jgi:trigger factor